MARFSRLHVLHQLEQIPFVPLFFHQDASVAVEVMRACYAGGVRVFEFTNRGDFAHETFGQIVKAANENFPDLVIGAGTIVDAPTAALYMQLGADFIVAPYFNADVAKLCNRRKVAYMPGCATLTEIGTAEEAGCEVVKLFPGDGLGPKFVKALKGPMPWSSILVTGGVEPTQASLESWFLAGATAVGLGSQLFKKEWLVERNYTAIEQMCRHCLSIIGNLKK